MYKTTVLLDFDIVGFHLYPDAPKQVEFLKNKHRHNFRIKVGFEVTDANREKEIFIEEDKIKFALNEWYGSPMQLENMSCEMLAEEILTHIKDDGGIFVEVLEDGRGGGRAEI